MKPRNYIGVNKIFEKQNNKIIIFAKKINIHTFWDTTKIAGGSIEFNYYPLGMGKFKYMIGPYFEYGVFAYKVRRYEETYGSYSYYYNYIISPLRYDGQHIAGGINNGFIYHINKAFTLTGIFGLGLKKDETTIAGDKILTQAKFNFIFGIKF